MRQSGEDDEIPHDGLEMSAYRITGVARCLIVSIVALASCSLVMDIVFSCIDHREKQDTCVAA